MRKGWKTDRYIWRKRCPFSEEALRAFADDALKKLDDGESEAEVKEWADSRVLAEDT